MAESETFEVSIISSDGKHAFLSSSLQTIGIDETFQSLFDHLMENSMQKESDLVLSSNSYPTTTNNDTIITKQNQSKLRPISPVSGNSPTPSFGDNSSTSNGNNKFIDKSDIKSVECQCFSSLQSSKSDNGCTVPLQFNILQTSKRHNFLRILYSIEIPLSSLSTTSPPPNHITTTSFKSSQRSSNSSKTKKYSKFHELVNHLNKSRSQKKILRGSKTRTKYKIYKSQESLLTLLFMVPEFKSMYSIFLAGFLLFFTSIIIDDFMNKGEITHSLSLVQWNFTNYNDVIMTWVYMIVYCFGLVLLFYCYKHQLYGFGIVKSKIYNDYIYIISYILYMIPLFIYPAIWSLEFNIAGSLIVACEQTRFILKSHAFFVETFKTKRYLEKYQKNKNKNKDKEIKIDHHEDDDEKLIESKDYQLRQRRKDKIPSKIDISSKIMNINNDEPTWLVNIDINLADMMVSFSYFLFIPMLVYRTSYPRTSYIRWNRVWQHFRDVLLSFISVWVLFCRFCIPIYRKSTIDPGNFSVLFSEFINGSLPGMMLLLLGFFGFLHSWLNLFAELLRFGDRQFYLDWWNARSFAQYYRKWNCVVHDWIYNYLYLPVIDAGYSRTFAMAIVFGTSALIHEYILIMGCKFCYPVLLFMFGGMGVFFVPFTRLWRNARGWNIFLWSMLLIGQGILLVLYSREYYARNLSINDPIKINFINTNSFVPHSIQLFNQRTEILKLTQQ